MRKNGPAFTFFWDGNAIGTGVVDLIVSGLMFGGGQRVVMDLAKQGRLAGDETQVLLLGRKNHICEKYDARVIGYDGRYNRIDTLIGTALRLRRHLRFEKPVLIHTHGWDADIIGRLAVLWMGVPQVIHLHVMPDWLRSRKLKHVARRAFTKRVYAGRQIRIVAVSQAVRRFWTESLPLNEEIVQVIHNGVDTSPYRPTDGTRADKNKVPVIGVAARLVAAKGIACLLTALAELAREGVVFQLRVAGDGTQRQELERQARVLRIARYVEFLGQVGDMPDFYNSIDVFACPSFTEGMPVTVLESLAAGKPVVASNVGGIPEAVRDGEEGILVSPGDSRALAAALRRLIEDDELRKLMGTKAELRARTYFSLEDFYTNVSRLYKEVLFQRVSTAA